MSKKVAVILINWNSYDLTRDTLNSLQKVTYMDLDVIVVDNGSTDGSGDRLEAEFPEVIMIKSSSNTGFTGGNNLGFQYALAQGYTYAMMLNNDVEVAPDFLAPLIGKKQSDEHIGAVQPLIYFHHDKNLIWNAGTKYNPWLGICSTIDYNKRDDTHAATQQPKRIDWITGCAFMIRASVLQKIGLLKEAFFIYYEDVDLSFRIKNAGYDLGYAPASVIYHIAGMSHKSSKKTAEGYVSPKVHYLNARNHIWLLKKYTNLLHAPTVILYQSIYYLSVTGYFIIRGRWQKIKALYKGIGEGLKFGIRS